MSNKCNRIARAIELNQDGLIESKVFLCNKCGRFQITTERPHICYGCRSKESYFRVGSF